MNIECVYAPTRILLIVSVHEVMCIRINTVHISIPDCIVISCHLALSIVPLYFPVHSYDMTIIMSDNAFHISHRPGDRASLPIPIRPHSPNPITIAPNPTRIAGAVCFLYALVLLLAYSSSEAAPMMAERYTGYNDFISPRGSFVTR